MFRKISFLVVIFSAFLMRFIVGAEAELEAELRAAGKRVGAEASSVEKDLPANIQNAMREPTADKAAKIMSELKDYNPSDRIFLDDNANRMTIARAMARRYRISINQAYDSLNHRLDFEKIDKNMWVPKGKLPEILEKTPGPAPSFWDQVFAK
jgi:hypothetical protein